MVCADYVEENGIFKVAHNGVRSYGTSVMLGCRDPGSPKYGSGDRHGPKPNFWREVRDESTVDVRPMDDPPIVNA